MNIVLLAVLAVCEIFFAGVLIWEFCTLLRWLDRKVFSPLLQKANDIVLRFYVRHLTEEWLFWEGRKNGSNQQEEVSGLREAGDGRVPDAED